MNAYVRTYTYTFITCTHTHKSYMVATKVHLFISKKGHLGLNKIFIMYQRTYLNFNVTIIIKNVYAHKQAHNS